MIYRKDYQKSTFQLPETELTFVLDKTATRVSAKLHFKNAEADKPIFLNGESLKSIKISLPYTEKEKGIEIIPPSKDFILETEVEINPEANTELSGLYLSDGLFTTQNEPQGFRRITYFPDHPDVMSHYRVTIKANKKDFPVRLSNGNIVAESENEITYDDPFPKPSYLFALVAGKLDVLTDTFTTKSGKKVDLFIYSEPGKKDRLTYAMDSIKKAMKWDEDVFGLEYDLNRFSIVAVSHFNAGAMENKSLNIFRDSLLLASPNTTSDLNYIAIESCIAHEYFHNYSGDRVTLQDWFDLSLKESLTVYRDSEFTYDMHDHTTERMEDIWELRAGQFAEDDGPLAHPILLEKAESVHNFYTSTIYYKGAEVIRMMREFVGKDAFMKGVKNYFKHFDGQAVRIEDFIGEISNASGQDFSQFMNWYHIPGRPVIKIETDYQASNFTVKMTQFHKKTDKPFVIPLRFGLVGKDGKDLETGTLILKEKEQIWTFKVKEKPVLSINRDFSALADIEIDYTPEERLHLMRFDSDLFNRYEVGHKYAIKSFVKMIEGEKDPPDKELLETMGVYLNQNLNPMFLSHALTLPTNEEIMNELKEVDPEKIQSVRFLMRRSFAEKYREKIYSLYKEMASDKSSGLSDEQMGKRALKNTLLSYLALTPYSGEARQQYRKANNFTERLGALSVMVNDQLDGAKWALNDFYKRYENDPIPLNKWFMVQARVPVSETVGVVKKLLNHPKFDMKTPSKVGALLGVFGTNLVAFNTKEGYELLAEQIGKLDKINSQRAAVLAESFRSIKKMTPALYEKAKKALTRLRETAKLSDSTREIVGKILDA